MWIPCVISMNEWIERRGNTSRTYDIEDQSISQPAPVTEEDVVLVDVVVG
jgi:hypothetical protein